MSLTLAVCDTESPTLVGSWVLQIAHVPDAQSALLQCNHMTLDPDNWLYMWMGGEDPGEAPSSAPWNSKHDSRKGPLMVGTCGNAAILKEIG